MSADALYKALLNGESAVVAELLDFSDLGRQEVSKIDWREESLSQPIDSNIEYTFVLTGFWTEITIASFWAELRKRSWSFRAECLVFEQKIPTKLIPKDFHLRRFWPADNSDQSPNLSQQQNEGASRARSSQIIFIHAKLLSHLKLDRLLVALLEGGENCTVSKLRGSKLPNWTTFNSWAFRINREDFIKLGGLDASFLDHENSELDFSYRLQASRFDMRFAELNPALKESWKVDLSPLIFKHPHLRIYDLLWPWMGKFRNTRQLIWKLSDSRFGQFLLRLVTSISLNRGLQRITHSCRVIRAGARNTLVRIYWFIFPLFSRTRGELLRIFGYARKWGLWTYWTLFRAMAPFRRVYYYYRHHYREYRRHLAMRDR